MNPLIPLLPYLLGALAITGAGMYGNKIYKEYQYRQDIGKALKAYEKCINKHGGYMENIDEKELRKCEKYRY